MKRPSAMVTFLSLVVAAQSLLLAMNYYIIGWQRMEIWRVVQTYCGMRIGH